MRLRRLEPVLRRALRGPCALPRGARVLVAVSGGADSTALLLALHSVAHEYGLSLCAAHLHHGLRGGQADADLEHVRALCAAHGVPLRAARWDTRARMRRAGLSGENGLRVLRRRFLAACARAEQAAAIATAHTADDQLETLLMRLARGTGLAGLGGMAPRRGGWLKPLLEATRADVEHDLRAAGARWREDASNRSHAHLRNRVRLEVVPALVAALDPSGPRDGAAARASLARRVTRSAAAARSARGVIARAALRRIGAAGTGPASVPVASLAGAARSVRHFAFLALWRRAGGGAVSLHAHHLRQLDDLLRSARGRGELSLPGGGRASRSAGVLAFRGPAAAAGRKGTRGPGNDRLRAVSRPMPLRAAASTGRENPRPSRIPSRTRLRPRATTGAT